MRNKVERIFYCQIVLLHINTQIFLSKGKVVMSGYEVLLQVARFILCGKVRSLTF